MGKSIHSKRAEDKKVITKNSMYSKKWNAMFLMLKKFKRLKGHCNVPKEWRDNKILANWVTRQRRLFLALEAGKSSSLSESQLDLLKEIGFDFRPSGLPVDKTRVDRWEDNFQMLKYYKRKHGTTKVVESQNKSLRGWVRRQMDLFQESSLLPCRHKKLDSIGFWSDRGIKKSSMTSTPKNKFDENWERMFTSLKVFKCTHGHCKIPKSYKENPKLGRWVHKQRQASRKLLLYPYRKQKLESVGFIFDFKCAKKGSNTSTPRKKQKLHNDENSRTSTPRKKQKLHNDENSRTSTPRKKQKLHNDENSRTSTSKNKQQLQSDENWERMFSVLKAFKHTHGHCKVPTKYKESPKLGYWVDRQRQASRKLLLCPHRKQKLESVGFVFDYKCAEKNLLVQKETSNVHSREIGEKKEKHQKKSRRSALDSHSFEPILNPNILERFLCEKCFKVFFETEEEALAHEASCVPG